MSDSLNQEFSKRVVINTLKEKWHNSPSTGVNRIYLERDNMSEFSIASSVVNFAANSSFDEHVHDNGEEIYVLDGVFSDQFGNYKNGTYLRNPDKSIHRPFSKEGCTILVKLRQFQDNDSERIIKDTNSSPWFQGLVPGLSLSLIHI